MRLIIPLGMIAVVVLAFCTRSVPPIFENRPLPAWQKELSSDDYKVRTKARQALVSMGEASVPFLVQDLRAQSFPLQTDLERLAARFAFRKMEWPHPALQRERALSVLSDLGPKSAGAGRAVIENLIYPDGEVALEAERVLRRMGPAGVRALLSAFSLKDPRLRAAAVRVLKDCATGDQKVAEALAWLAREDKSAAVRAQTALSLARISPQTTQTIETLCLLAKDEDAALRAAAAEAMTETGSKDVRLYACLKDLLADASPPVRFQAARSVWRLQGDTQLSVPVLIVCLKQPEIGWKSAFVLGEMKGKAEPAIPALVGALWRETVTRPLRSAPSTCFALGAIGRPSVPYILPALAAAEARIRTSGAIALGFMGPQADEAVPAMIPLLKDREPTVRQATALALVAICKAEEAKPVLIEMLRAEDIYVRMDAADALRKIDPSREWQSAPE